MSTSQTSNFPHVERLGERAIADVLLGLPAVMLVGPRASGKTTTARRFAKTVVRLDREMGEKVRRF